MPVVFETSRDPYWIDSKPISDHRKIRSAQTLQGRSDQLPITKAVLESF